MLSRSVIACVALLSLAGCRRDERRTLVVVSNEDSGELTIIDATSDEIVRSIFVGSRPRGMRPSPDGKLLYVAVSGSKKGGERDAAEDGIAVVDLEARRVVRVLHAGRDPESFDVTRDGAKIYVANEETAEVTVVDAVHGRALGSITVGAEPEGVTIAPDGKTVWITCEAANEVHVVRTDTDVPIARIATGGRPRAVAFDRTGQRAFVTAENGGVVDVVDTKSFTKSASISTGEGARPMGVALSSDGALAFVTNGRAGSIGVVDVPGERLARTIDGVGGRAWGIGATPDGKKLYVAAGKEIAVVDPRDGTVKARLPARGAWGVAIVTEKR